MVREEESPSSLRGAWEWDSRLAALRRAEAEEEFQQLLRNAEEGIVVPNNVANTNPLPPHERPRKKQKDYCCSPLEPNHDDKLIPDCQIDGIASALPSAIQRERLFQGNILPLMGKKIWKYRGLNYEESHPRESALEPTPNDWAEDDDKAGQPWPGGCKYESGVFALCWAFFCFVYNKNKGASIKVILCEAVCSLVPPACSYLFGTGLLDELSGSTSRGQDDRTRIMYTALYAAGILLLRIFSSWLTVYYCNSIPVGGTRTALRDLLFQRMQNLKSPLKDKLTPGASSGIIVDKVYEAVGIYYQFLTFPALVIGILGNIAVSWTSLPFHYIPIVSVPTIVVILLAVTLPVIINLWFQPEYCILTRLEHQWRLRLRSLAGSAIPREGQSYRSSGTKHDRSSEEGELRGIFHECAFLETMRHWQAWKLSVVEGFLIGSLSQTGIAVVTISAGYAAITNVITVGNFTTLISCVKSIVTLGESIGSFLTGLYEEHMMLRQIVAIMNDEDISFDGGVDVFEKELEHVKDVGQRVGGHVKNTGKKVATAGTHAVHLTIDLTSHSNSS